MVEYGYVIIPMQHLVRPRVFWDDVASRLQEDSVELTELID
jgi:hypothetical protein